MPKQETINVVFESPEYALACQVSTDSRSEVNYSIGVILTMVEAALGEGVQTKALKSLVRQELWRLADQLNRLAYGTIMGDGKDGSSVPYVRRYPQPTEEELENP